MLQGHVKGAGPSIASDVGLRTASCRGSLCTASLALHKQLSRKVCWFGKLSVGQHHATGVDGGC